MAYLNVDGDRRIYYEHYAGDARAIVLIHGWGASTRCWDTTLPALLAAGHEVVALDVRAAGKSDNDFADVTIDATASDVIALIEATGLDRPVINGWSAGGGIAGEVAIRLGDRSSGLVLTCGASPRYTQGPDWPHGGTLADIEGTVAGIRADRAAGFRGVAGAVCAADSDVSPDAVDWMWHQFMELGVRGDDLLLSLAEIDQRDGLRALPVPALIFGGRQDLFVPFDATKATADLIPDARFVETPGGHAPFLEVPDLYRDELLAFLAKVV
ncbi:alpha/beta fold hydrolase [Patulibacter sp.]|uniref:alpha/beta fold hydrolase n=1 Tax=Patulibacter sp. TaxID=1912859 RepID=UPI002723271B|nr:alpha/beta hydrolase [Patulibacter sp.]MDO9410837.1 alpha/beta hydrolase [Patulibacter sp.]